MPNEEWHRGRLEKLSREQLLEELLQHLVRGDEADDHFLFGKGKRGARAEAALHHIRPALRHTTAVSLAAQTVWDVSKAQRGSWDRLQV